MADKPSPQTQTRGTRRVNAPYGVDRSQAAIFWFGHVTPTQNSVDARVRYTEDQIYLRIAAFDRRLWYDTSPSPDDLTDWDAVTLYLDTDGGSEDVLDSNTHRLEAQLVWWEPRASYQAAYQGDGGSWVSATTLYTTTSGWRGNAPLDDVDDRGWWLVYRVPFDGLGLTGPPAQGTIWRMGLTLHDRDDSVGTPIANQVWPETMVSNQPSTWGQLAFGMPTYDRPPALTDGTVTIRQGLNGALVPDAGVGGSSVCGQPAAPDYFPTWGALNYAGKEFFNIQNQEDVADWPCFSRYYVTFPLDTVPAGKVVNSATLTLHVWGGAGQGWEPEPRPSFIQALTVGEAWDESTITWNNAPLAVENVSGTWVEPVEEYTEPGIPYEWDVSGAAAQAYTAGEPLRLALYEADFAYHSGKYFRSSDTEDWIAEARPTLVVAWGRAVADLDKAAVPPSGVQGDPITYTLSFLGSGNSLTLTDTLPIGANAPAHFQLEGTSITPSYDSAQHRLTWTDAPPAGQEVVIRYSTTIATSDRQALVSTAELKEAGGDTSTAAVTVLANPCRVYLPVAFRDQ